MNGVISEERMEQAVNFLAETDHDYAMAKAELERSEIHRKRVRSRIFLSEEGAVAVRQAKAEVHADTVAMDDRYIQALAAFEDLRARRQRAEIVIDVFRTLEASRRKGL